MISLALAFFSATILCSAAAERRLVVVIGGLTHDPHEDMQGRVGITSVEALDLETGVWRNDSIARLPAQLARTQALSLDGRLYAIGGSVFQPQPWNKSEWFPWDLRVPLVYDPFGETNNWTTAAAFPYEVVDSASFALMASKVYAVGGGQGVNREDGSYGPVGRAKVFDPKIGMWTPIANMTVGRWETNIAVLGNVLYAAGGCYKYGTCGGTAAVEKYDASTDTWSSVASMNFSRYGHNLVALAGKLYAFGGVRDDHFWSPPLASVEAYDPVADAWHFVSPMPTSRFGAGAVIVDGRVYVVGGWTRTTDSKGVTQLDTVDVYDASADAWKRLPGRMTIARSNFGIALFTVPTSAALTVPSSTALTVPSSAALTVPSSAALTVSSSAARTVPSSAALTAPSLAALTARSSAASSLPVGSLLLLSTLFLWCH